ncbi:MAG TPA: hypothetical protein VF587_11400 [Solirubrobacteraceae bacterium]|jgi:hypothetical protein
MPVLVVTRSLGRRLRGRAAYVAFALAALLVAPVFLDATVPAFSRYMASHQIVAAVSVQLVVLTAFGVALERFLDARIQAREERRFRPAFLAAGTHLAHPAIEAHRNAQSALARLEDYDNIDSIREIVLSSNASVQAELRRLADAVDRFGPVLLLHPTGVALMVHAVRALEFLETQERDIDDPDFVSDDHGIRAWAMGDARVALRDFCEVASPLAALAQRILSLGAETGPRFK